MMWSVRDSHERRQRRDSGKQKVDITGPGDQRQGRAQHTEPQGNTAGWAGSRSGAQLEPQALLGFLWKKQTRAGEQFRTS